MAHRSLRSVLVLVCLLPVCTLPAPVTGDEKETPRTTEPAAAKPVDASPPPGNVEMRFTDGSSLKLTLRDERLKLVTPYGTLQFPVADVQRVEFASRTPADLTRRIEAALGNLGSPLLPVRAAAGAELLKLRGHAYPALLQAAKHKDKEIARRAEELLERLRQAVPEAELQVRKHDVVHTPDSKFIGRLEGTTLKAVTLPFGEVTVKLADVRSLRSLTAPAEDEGLAAAADDPGTLMRQQQEIGKTFRFRVTGAGLPGLGWGGGSLWGSDVYTTDSTLALAAVHAGVLKPGQTGVVKVKIVASPPSFEGSTRNGISSSPYPVAYSGAYRVSR